MGSEINMKAGKGPSAAKSFRSVMQQHEGPLLRYAARIVGNLESARDVVQDTFLRLWRSDHMSDDHLAEWLFAVCRNRAIDIVRKEQRMTQWQKHMDTGNPSPERLPPAVAEENEELGRAVKALSGLPETQQEVLRLKFQNDFSYKQIARITGHSVSNIGFLIHTAIKKLREQLKADGLMGRA